MKVSIPKEELERIQQEYNCSEAEAARAFLEASEAGRKHFEDELARQLGKNKQQQKAGWRIPILTPAQIKAHLDKFVIGQEEYKKRLSIATAFHFAIIKYLEENPEKTKVRRFRKKNTIIAGPSGSGKTYCAEVLGDLLQVPTLIVDATDYTEAGYVGKSADDMIRELIDMAPGGSRVEKIAFIDRYGGIIFIDEIDKKAKDGKLIGHDISREGFQRAVLKLIERKFVATDNPFSPAGQIQELMNRQKGSGGKEQDNMISTEKILFVVGGSFQRPQDDLESIVKERFRHQSGKVREDGRFVVTGFGAEEKDSQPKPMANYYKAATAEDYIRFGLIPELVGRVPIRSHVNLLSKNDLIRIMKETEDSIIQQYVDEFRAFGIDFRVEDAAVEYVAEKAENKKTGARALVSVWENILSDFQFELPGSQFHQIIVTRDLCERPEEVLHAMFKRSPFVYFIDTFKREYDIDLEFAPGVEDDLERHAQENQLQVSDALRKLQTKLSALNYMNVKGKFAITREMIDDPKYFDNLFTEWHQKGH